MQGLADNNLSRQLATGGGIYGGYFGEGNIRQQLFSDVEVDVHAAPVDLFQVEGNNNGDNTLTGNLKLSWSSVTRYATLCWSLNLYHEIILSQVM